MTILVGSQIAAEGYTGAAKGIVSGAIVGMGMGGAGIVSEAGTRVEDTALAAGVAGGSAAAGAVFASMADGGVGPATALGTVTSALSGMATSYLAGQCASAIPPYLRMIVLGTTVTDSRAQYTFDCWKTVVHDESQEPSRGRTLHEIAQDKRIKSVRVKQSEKNDLPDIVFTNIWDETFGVKYVLVNSTELNAHAVRLNT